MTKRALLAVAGFFAFAFRCRRSRRRARNNSYLMAARSIVRRSARKSGPLFPSTTFGSMHSASDFLPTVQSVERRSVVSPAMLDSKVQLGDVVEMRARIVFRSAEKWAFFYGKSTGKYGRRL